MDRPTLDAATVRLAGLIDHTILKPDATQQDIDRFCDEAVKYGFHSVCVNPIHVDLTASKLAGSDVSACSVVGFPFGATTAKSKAAEAADAILNGAREIDMVIAIGALKDGRFEVVRKDIEAVRAATKGSILKVIIETSLLTDDEKRIACELAQAAQADYVKTSTGYGGGGATVADVALMRRVIGPSMGLKASGGIRNRADAEAMIEAGATRIGASSGLAIIGQLPATAQGY